MPTLGSIKDKVKQSMDNRKKLIALKADHAVVYKFKMVVEDETEKDVVFLEINSLDPLQFFAQIINSRVFFYLDSVVLSKKAEFKTVLCNYSSSFIAFVTF